MHRVEGSYALGIIFSDYPDTVYSVRKDSPLIVGKGTDGNLIASDVPAVLKYTREVFFIQNEEIACLKKDAIEFYNVDGEPIQKESKMIEWDVNAAEKGGYEHFMLKEMYEQPKTVRDTLSPRIKDGKIEIEELGMTDEEIRAINRIHIVACGSAYHTGVTAKYVFEGMARIPVEVDLASEFRYRNPILDENDLVIIISQSGETADSLAALREAKSQEIKTLGIVNVIGSSIAREADKVMYTWAGPEIAVATTKAYSAQVDRTVPVSNQICSGKRQDHRSGSRGILRRSEKTSGSDRTALIKPDENTEICKPLYRSKRCVLYRKRHRLCDFHGGFLKVKGNILCTFRSICGRRIKTWNDFLNRGRNLSSSGCNPGRPL